MHKCRRFRNSRSKMFLAYNFDVSLMFSVLEYLTSGPPLDQTQRKIEKQCRVVKDAVKVYQPRNQQVQNVHASVCAHLRILEKHVE